MKLKGKATFELTNVETGEKRVVKEENMVTNAFQHMIQCTGIIGCGPQMITNPGYNDGVFYPMINNGTSSASTTYALDPILRYTHGLLLFQDKLEEEPDHIYVTADDPELTGVGAELAYIGNNPLAGSYNKNESGRIENGYKHVWDFTTSQANGDIGCACLTPLMSVGLGGGVGFPQEYSDWYGSLDSERNYRAMRGSTYFPSFDDYVLATTPCISTGYLDFGRNLFIRPKEYFAFPLDGGSTDTEYVSNEYDVNGNVTAKKTFDRTFLYKKSIDLDIFRFPYSNFSIFDSGYKYYDTRKYNGTSAVYVLNNPHVKYLQTVTVNMPTGLANLIPADLLEKSITTNYYWPTQIHCDEGFMYISFTIPKGSGNSNGNLTLSSGDKIYVWKINMNTFESSYFTITNTTGQDIPMYYNVTPFSTYKQWIITNEYAILFSTPRYASGNMWIIDTATGSTIKQVVNLYDDSVLDKSSTYQHYYIRNNMIYFFYNANNTFNPMLIINLKTGYAKYGRSSGLYNWSTFGVRPYGTKLPYIVYVGSSTANSYYTSYLSFYTDPQFLMTINNLEDTVTKTSAETMKVTYIITESEDE